MSGTESAPTSQPPPVPRPKPSGCASAAMALFGIILLFPGVCFLNFGGGGPLGLIGLLLSGTAVILVLSAAIRTWGSTPPPS